MFITALFTTAKTRTQSLCPLTDESIKKIYTHTMEYHLAIKRPNIAICSNMDATRDYHTK